MSTERPHYAAMRVDIEDLADLPREREDGITYAFGDEIADNSKRATGGFVALAAYYDATYSGGEEPETVLGDLLGDLMHAADALALDFDTALNRAQGDHNAEVHGEDY